MKKVVIIASLLLPLSLAFAQPTIHGDLSGILGPGTYIVDGDCQVPAGEHLRIAPNTTFLHNGHHTWRIYGELTAIGTVTQRIHFVRQLPIEDHLWGGLRFQPGASAQCILDWCEIDHCDNSTLPFTHGGGVSLEIPITIRNTTITNCKADEGGGIYGNGAHFAVIENCTISNCEATDYSGGAMLFITSMDPIISNCMISHNSAAVSGGALYFSWSGAVLERNVIHSNTAGSQGGAIFCISCSATLNNNTIVFNRVEGTGGQGGGLCTHVDSGFLGFNNIIYYNYAETDPECHINYPGMAYCCISTEFPWYGNIEDDPMFVDTTNYDFHLQAISPCIDAGNPATAWDPDSTLADMGAYYYNQSGTPDMNIDLTYLSGSPVPPSGGVLTFDLVLENQDIVSLDFDAWLEIAYEGGAPSTIVQRSLTAFPPGGSISRPDAWYPIPESYVAGNYTFTGKVGIHPDDAWDESGFPFEKLGTDHSGSFVPFPCNGAPNPFLENQAVKVDRSEATIALKAHPNPFNAELTLRFSLPEAENVSLNIYDLTGREIATVTEGQFPSNWHQVEIYTTNWTSGMYVVRLTVGNKTTVQKIILLK